MLLIAAAAAAACSCNECASQAGNPFTSALSAPLQYHFDRGLYMHEVVPGLFCGTQPRNPQEVEELAHDHRVTVIMNLQQDKDMEHWGVNLGANQQKCNELGIKLLRKPV